MVLIFTLILSVIINRPLLNLSDLEEVSLNKKL